MAAGPTDGSNEQAAAIAFLSDPKSHAGAQRVDVIETHGNIIFLAGPYAWKIKRAVRFPYMDFSTLALRHAACLSEMAVNARLAPGLYVACVPITREGPDKLAFGGQGPAIEWAVKMHRFEQSDLLSARAERGPLPTEVALAVADAVRASHESAEVQANADGSARVMEVLQNLLAALRGLPLLEQPAVEAFSTRAHAWLDRTSALIDRRAARGCVRRCHGDLHAANIVIWKGAPVLYDAIEFDETLATIDTLYDLAFLLMDLDQRGQCAAANAILNRYLGLARGDLDLEGVAVLPLFMALRAAIRALVTAERATQEDAEASRADRDHAQGLLRAAVGYLDTVPPALVAVAGLSGTGKSTLAAGLAPLLGGSPGAIHLRTDLIRKALAGVAATQRLPAETYTPEASARVYAELARQARLVLLAGRSVVADAVCAHAHERDALGDVARDLGGAFRGLWLTAPAEILVARVEARRNDASDATSDVVRRQLGWQSADLGEGWTTIDAGGTADDTLRHAERALGGLLSKVHKTGQSP